MSATASAACAVTVAGVGVLGLTGWLLDVAILKSVIPGETTMMPNTAAGLSLVGASLWLVRSVEASALRRWSARAMAITVGVLGALTLAEYLAGVDLGIDRLLVDEVPSGAGVAFPGRMAVPTALSFALAGAALLLVDVRTGKGHRPAVWITVAVLALSLVTLIGYLYGVRFILEFGGHVAIAIHTAAGFLILGVGILTARPSRGPVALLTESDLAGVMLRRLLPPVLLGPVLFGWLRLEGERWGLFSTEMGVALNTLLTVALLTGSLCLVSLALARVDDDRRRLNVELEARVADRTAQLEGVVTELEAFSYSVSHDLRAPLRAMDGFSQILLDEFASELPQDGRRYLHMVREGAQEMGALVDDLLSFSRVSREALDKQAVDPAHVARGAWAQLAPQREGRRVEIGIEELPECEADPSLLKQVFANLLGNALKFTRDRDVAEIEVGSVDGSGATTYFVRDNGVGFDMDYADKLFGVFQRLHRAEEYEGTGVGLAIVQRIVHRHGGRVWAEGEPDRGATFFFTLEGGDSDG